MELNLNLQHMPPLQNKMIIIGRFSLKSGKELTKQFYLG
jgi:hypothetical protein